MSNCRRLRVMISAIQIVRLLRIGSTLSALRWRSFLALTTLLSFVWTPLSQSADFWVSPRGTDVAERGARTRPWATLQFAADHVRAGDTVHVVDGNYSGFDLRHGGDPDAAVRFTAEGKNVMIVRRNAITPDGINVEGASHVVLDGFVVEKMPRSGVRAVVGSHITIRGIRTAHNGMWGIFTAHCDDVTIVGNQASGSLKEHGIYVSNSGDRPIIRGNVSWGNRGCGIHMNGDLSQGGDGIISQALVESNVIFDNGRGGGSGINCDGVQDSKVQNNLLYNNHSSGISLYRICAAAGSTGNYVVNNRVVQPLDARWAVNIRNASTNNFVANNILLHKGSKGSLSVSADSMSGFRSDSNIVTDRFSPDDGYRFMTLAEWRSVTGFDRHSRVSNLDEVFVNSASNNYHLRSGSVAIDNADPAFVPRTDLEGRIRPAGAVPDIGAYEMNSANDAGQP